MSDFITEIKPKSCFSQAHSSIPGKDDYITEIKPKSCHSQAHSSIPGKDDYITEIKPKSYLSQVHSSIPGKDDFVAEIRPRSSHQTNPNQTQGVGSSCNDSDSYLQKMLSGKKISREDLTRLLEGSLVTLVETLLTGRSMSRIEGTLCISFHGSDSPVVVNLQKTFPEISNSKRSAELILENCLNVKVKAREASVLSSTCDHPVMLCSPSDGFDRDPCHSPPDRGIPACSGTRDERFSLASTVLPNSYPPSPVNDSISSTTVDVHLSSFTCEVSSASSSPKPDAEVHETQLEYSVNDSPKNRDSDVESGYLSNEKEDSEHASYNGRLEKSVGGFNDYFCSGFDGAGVRYMSVESPASDDAFSKHDPDSCASSAEGSDEMIDDPDDDCERQLVIDEHAINDVKTGKLEEIFQADEHRGSCCSLPEKVTVVKDVMNVIPVQTSLDEEEEEDSMTVECEDVESSVCLDIAGANTNVELPGNSRFSGDHVLGSQHPQSIVSRHVAGFMCKPCLRILPDATSASFHVNSEHDLHLCTHCFRTFTAKNNLKRHVRRHTGQRPYKCHNCPQSFFRRDDLKGHMIRHEHKKPFRCSLCQKGYTDRACVKNHMAKEHRSRLMHVCPQCGESFDCEESFTSHKGTHPELQQFACSTCSFIGTNHLMTLKHNLLHSHKLFSCKPCNAHFADPFHYTNHVKKHKHMSTFTHYVCCFCNVVLGTYEQFVRHEYSHAQCKMHACTVCRKQFRSKILLQDHIKTHQQPDPIATGHLSETIETERSRQDDQQTHFLNVNLEQGHDEFTGQRSQWHEEDTSSGVIQAEHDEYYGQLLDLSMKKSSSPKYTNDSFNSEENQVSSYDTSVRATCASVNDGPRNGARSTDPACLSPECGHTTAGFQYSHPVKDGATDESTYKPTLNNLTHVRRNTNLAVYRSQFSPASHDKPIQFVNIADRYAYPDLSFANQARQDERAHISGVPSVSERKLWHRAATTRPSSKPPLLFSPYNREKMADLAAKFMVARGSKVIGEKGRVKLIAAAGSEEKKAGDKREQSIAQKQQKHLLLATGATPMETDGSGKNALLDLTGQGSDNVVSEYSNLGTTLRCHIPTVVKPEPLKELDENAGSPLDFRFRALKAEDAGSKSFAVGSYSCDICRDMFATFLELEDHSVEVHKRYLCEHCKKGFTARPNRDRHVRYHTGERPYKCDLCELAFFRGDDLKYHRTTRHPTAQPYVCPRCSANFTWGRDLERHIRHSKCKV